MTYDIEKKNAGRKPLRIFTLKFPKCANVYGSAPCTASGSAGSECYNARKHCQDPVNYDGSATLAIKLCELTVEHQFDIGAIPCIEKINTAHSQIEPGQASTGKSAGLQLVCTDFPHHDRGIDPYVSTRTYTPEEQGTYFGKLKARNPYYQNIIVEKETGYLADGYDAANFKKRTYFLEKFEGPDKIGKIKFVAQDIMRQLDDDRVTCPEITTGELTTTLSASETISFTITGDADKYDTANGAIRINEEIIEYTTGVDNSDGTFTFSTLTRGVDDTDAAEHAVEDSVQKCVTFTAQTGRQIAYALYVTYGPISSSYINTTQWDTVADIWLQKTYTRRITEPTGIKTLLGEIHQQMGFFTFWDEENSVIKLEAIRPPEYSIINTYLESESIIDGSVEVSEKPDKRITQVHVYHNAHTPIEGTKDSHFASRHKEIDVGAESDDQYGDSRILEVFARWLNYGGSAGTLGGRILNRFRDNLKPIKFRMDAKDEDLNTGDQCYLNFDVTNALQDGDGSAGNTLVQIVQRDEIKSGAIYEYRAQIANYYGRYIYIGASGSPNYGSATDEQKSTIGYISSAGGGDFSDGGTAHKII